MYHWIHGLTASQSWVPTNSTYQMEKLKLGPHDWTGTILTKRQGNIFPSTRCFRENVSGWLSFFRPLQEKWLGLVLRVNHVQYLIWYLLSNSTKFSGWSPPYIQNFLRLHTWVFSYFPKVMLSISDALSNLRSMN